MISVGSRRLSSRMRRRTSSPSMPFILRSVMTKSAGWRLKAAMAAAAFAGTDL